MFDNKHSEFSRPREDKRLLPDGRPRPATPQENTQDIRTAMIRETPLPKGTRPGTPQGS
jgi:hypothetical protein